MTLQLPSVIQITVSEKNVSQLSQLTLIFQDLLTLTSLATLNVAT